MIPSSSSVLNKRRKERKNALRELFPLSRARIFVSVVRVVLPLQIERKRREKHHREKNISSDAMRTGTKTYPKLEHVVFDLDQNYTNRE